MGEGTGREAPGASLALQRLVLLLALAVLASRKAVVPENVGSFTPAAPPSGPLMAGSEPLSLLLGAAGTDKLSH